MAGTTLFSVFLRFTLFSACICCVQFVSPPAALLSRGSLTIQPGGKIADTVASYEQVEEINHVLHSHLEDILRTDFFGYYRLNLYEAQCPVSWGGAFPMCGNRACAVDTLEEEQIPEVWRASVLGKVDGPIATHPSQLPVIPQTGPQQTTLLRDTAESCVLERNGYDSDRDYCIPEDESAGSGHVYVSLVDNPERFTGYAGEHSHAVWREIYRENCFELQQPSSSGEAEAAFVSKGHRSPGRSVMSDLEAIMSGRTKGAKKGWRKSGATLAQEYDQLRLDNTCLEKRVFWRLISGMHTSISTHLCWAYLNQTTGQWGPNLECFKSRVLTCPQWIENLYFNYVVVLRAVTKLSHFLDSYAYCSGDPTQDTFTKEKVHSLVQAAQIAAPSFDESRMFDPNDPTIIGLKDEFRQRFRNVSRVMDCVGCDKCRLWGKVQTTGYGTALKVLFEFDPEANEGFHLRRTEVVSLIVTLQRLSHSIWAVERFREMDRNPRPTTPLGIKDKIMGYVQGMEFTPFRDAFDEEFREIILAFKFILKSYILLPVNLWKAGVTFMARIWDRYVIGDTVFERGRLSLNTLFGN